MNDKEILSIFRKFIEHYSLPMGEDRKEYKETFSFYISNDIDDIEDLEDFNKIKEWLNNEQ